MKTHLAILFSLAVLLTGCASANYITPAEPVDLLSYTDAPADAPTDPKTGKRDFAASIDANFKSQPTARFPARVAIMQISGHRYGRYESQYGPKSLSNQETFDEVVKNLTNKKIVSAMANLNPDLFEKNASDIQSIRLAASKIKADLLILYTLDTQTKNKDLEVGPLNLLLLGFVPNQNINITSKASAVVLDVRTGFVYGLCEADGSDWGLATIWNDDATSFRCANNAEDQALSNLWVKGAELLETLAKNPPASRLSYNNR